MSSKGTNGAARRGPPPSPGIGPGGRPCIPLGTPVGTTAEGGADGMAALYVELRSLMRFAADLDGILTLVDEVDAEVRRRLGSNYSGLVEAWGDAAAQIRSKCFALGFVTARITIEVEAGTWTPDGGSSE